MRKFLVNLLCVALLLCVVVNPNSAYAEQISSEIVLDELDWSHIGAKDVMVVFRDVKNLASRRLNNPSVEITFYLEGIGDIYFERIGNTGYFYVNNELSSTVDYYSSNAQRIGMPSELTELYFSRPETGFTTFNYWAYESFIIQQVKGAAVSLILGRLTTAIVGSFAAYQVYQSSTINIMTVGDF